MYKKIPLSLAMLLVLIPLLMAMGTGDSEGPTRIPEPQFNYRVLLTDQMGTRVELTQFSIEGQSFVMGEVGKGEAAVPFAKVKEVTFANQGDMILAKLNAAGETMVELLVKPSLKATGKANFGNYSIPLGEVSRIEILGLVK